MRCLLMSLAVLAAASAPALAQESKYYQLPKGDYSAARPDRSSLRSRGIVIHGRSGRVIEHNRQEPSQRSARSLLKSTFPGPSPTNFANSPKRTSNQLGAEAAEYDGGGGRN